MSNDHFKVLQIIIELTFLYLFRFSTTIFLSLSLSLLSFYLSLCCQLKTRGIFRNKIGTWTGNDLITSDIINPTNGWKLEFLYSDSFVSLILDIFRNIEENIIFLLKGRFYVNLSLSLWKRQPGK